MKVITPEISWHAKEAIYSVDIQPTQEEPPLRVATAGIDSNVRIWELTEANKTGVTFLSNLTRHDKAVNVVRFSKSGKILASGGDDGTIVLWKLSDKTEAPNIFEEEADIGKNVETWTAYKMLRGHIEDINDLSWSSDEKFMISGSIDQTAIMWDITKGCKLCILSEAKHFIHGVAWDPLGQYAAVLSCDRSLRIYNIQTRRVIHNVSKMVYPEVDDTGEEKMEDDETPTIKAQRMFHDESVVRRRLDFTSDGNLLIVPSGCLSRKVLEQSEQIHTAYIFVRGCLSKPAAVLQGFKQPVTVVRCCPAMFQLRETNEDNTSSLVNLPYRIVFAVVSSDALLLYDTQHIEPFALIGNIHYAAITDVTWSSDGQRLIASSRDGFCTVVFFEKGELGEIYSEEICEEKVVLCNGIDASHTPNEKDNVIIINDNSNSLESMDSDITPLPLSNEDTESKKNRTATEDCSKNDKDKNMEVNLIEPQKSDPPQSSSLSQEKKPRRVQLVTVSESPSSQATKSSCAEISQSPSTKPPRRINLTSVQSHETDSSLQNKEKTPVKTAFSEAYNHTTSATKKTPKSATVTPKSSPATSKNPNKSKKAPRRIQLTQVSDN